MASAPDPTSAAARPWASPRVIATALLAGLWCTLPLLLSIALFASIESVTGWLHGMGERGPWIAAGIFALAAGAGLLPTYAQSVLAGWVFGFTTGTWVSACGGVVGAVTGYALSRAVAGDAMRTMIDAHPRWGVVRRALTEASFGRTLLVVTLLRFPPNVPFSFANLVFASTGVRFLPMVLGSLVGMLPRTAVAVWIGAQGSASGAKNFGDLVKQEGWTATFIGIGALVVALLILQAIGNRALRAAGLDGESTKG
ncbi:MAG: VTT domain-containing protein [Phycisphaerales bacterium]